MSWMVPKRMLDNDQRKAIDFAIQGDNCFICGDPGTGKSIVLAHIALEYKIMHPEAKVCVLTYTNALVACLEEGITDDGIPVMNFNKFMSKRGGDKFDLVLIDEAQDLQPDWAERILKLGNKFVLFGDLAQSIYGLGGVRITEEQLKATFQVRAVIPLCVDYRLPRNHRELVQAIYPDRTFASRIWRLMANAQIPLYHAVNWDEEMSFVVQKAKNHAVVGRPVAILFEQKRSIFRFMYTILGADYGEKVDLKKVNDDLREKGIPFRFLGNGVGDLKEGDEKPLTYVMTWHSSKGLDFETVLLPDLGRSTCRCNPFYVALTRARRNLVLSYSGRGNIQIEKAIGCKCVCPISTDRTGKISPTHIGYQQGTLF